MDNTVSSVTFGHFFGDDITIGRTVSDEPSSSTIAASSTENMSGPGTAEGERKQI